MRLAPAQIAAISAAVVELADSANFWRTRPKERHLGEHQEILVLFWFDEPADQYRATVEYCDLAGRCWSLAASTDRRRYRCALGLLASLAARQASADTKDQTAHLHS